MAQQIIDRGSLAFLIQNNFILWNSIHLNTHIKCQSRHLLNGLEHDYREFFRIKSFNLIFDGVPQSLESVPLFDPRKNVVEVSTFQHFK